MDANQVFAVLWAKLNSIAKEKGLEQKVVTVLPATGEKSYLYFVPNGSTGDNYYDEYVWDTEREVFERVGSTDVVLPEPDGSTLVETNGVWSVNIAQNAGAHNAVYRGKYLGTSVTPAQYAEIAAGTFKDLYIGDYWTIGNVNYRIAAFDYYLNCGDTATTAHHVVLVPDACLYNAQMNATNTTEGAYVGSAMYGSNYLHTGGNLAQAVTTIKAAFSGHVLKHRIYLQNAVANGKASAGAWVDSEVDLMTEQMVYGGAVFNPANDGTTVPYNYRVEKSQLALFTHEPSRITNKENWWLRDVVSASHFADVYNYGHANCTDAYGSRGVRPAFCIS